MRKETPGMSIAPDNRGGSLVGPGKVTTWLIARIIPAAAAAVLFLAAPTSSRAQPNCWFCGPSGCEDSGQTGCWQCDSGPGYCHTWECHGCILEKIISDPALQFEASDGRSILLDSRGNYWLQSSAGQWVALFPTGDGELERRSCGGETVERIVATRVGSLAHLALRGESDGARHLTVSRRLSIAVVGHP